MSSEQPFDYDVFLSHAKLDKRVVRELAERLRRDGIRVWFDEWSIQAGDIIPEKIERGLALQRHLIALLKFAPVESRFCSCKQRGKATFDTPINPCARSACSRSVAVGLILPCIHRGRPLDSVWHVPRYGPVLFFLNQVVQ